MISAGTERTILVAEDDENDAFLLRRAFGKASGKARLQFVRDGQEAMDYLLGKDGFADRTSHPFPDLLMLDVKMPRLSGLEVLEQVRRDANFECLVAIMLTSSAAPGDVRCAYKLGANSYLVKPVSIDALTNVARLVQEYWFGLNQEVQFRPGQETPPANFCPDPALLPAAR